MKIVRLCVLMGTLFSCVAIPALAQDRNIFVEGESRFRAGNYELALERYDTLLREYPGSELVPDTQFRRGVSLFRLSRFDEALRVFERVQTRFRSTRFVDLVPFWLGVTHYELSNYEVAIPFLDLYLGCFSFLL